MVPISRQVPNATIAVLLLWYAGAAAQTSFPPTYYGLYAIDEAHQLLIECIDQPEVNKAQSYQPTGSTFVTDYVGDTGQNIQTAIATFQVPKAMAFLAFFPANAMPDAYYVAKSIAVTKMLYVRNVFTKIGTTVPVNAWIPDRSVTVARLLKPLNDSSELVVVQFGSDPMPIGLYSVQSRYSYVTTDTLANAQIASCVDGRATIQPGGYYQYQFTACQ